MNTVDRINIPAKFQSINKTFMEHLKYEKGGVFVPFPSNTSFLGKEDDENVLLILRKHRQSLIPALAGIVFLLLLPILIGIIIPAGEQKGLFLFSLFLISVLVSASVGIFSYIRWFYNVNIITDQRVIAIDFESLFSHKTTEARLENIEGITFKQVGEISKFLDVGSVYIQTTEGKSEIGLHGIHNPKQVQDILSDLLESKKEGEI